jgi:hypothetical protein
VGCEVKPDEIFKATEHINSIIKLVFISACYSESIGKIFKAKGVPIVIAVN